tara:strand:+ start:3984 stop:4214 length:231 start_codon:yes stop_codon:yes gene_type:complete
MTKEEALKQTKERFTNHLDGSILPGISVSKIISYYEDSLEGNKPDSSMPIGNIESQFLEKEIEDNEFYLRNGYTRE